MDRGEVDEVVVGHLAVPGQSRQIDLRIRE